MRIMGDLCKWVVVGMVMMVWGACNWNVSFNAEETALLRAIPPSGIMRVYKITSPSDSLFLRQQAKPFTMEALDTEEYGLLKAGMLATVQDTTDAGVGIAAPQIGISRCLIAVQRFDKPAEPFEFYINPEIVYYSEEKAEGWEGCLSIPDVRAGVERSKEIVVSYIDEITKTEKRDTVRGFTAVIFQHETDHLKGILFTDRVKL